MRFIFDDGGRAAAGFKGTAGDCVCRAIAIASGRPYLEVYKRLAAGQGTQRRTKRTRTRDHAKSARNGIYTTRKWFREYMAELGFSWIPTMHIGSGCKVHLVDGELPPGRLVVALSKHYTAVIDGVIHDTYSPEREGGGVTVYYENNRVVRTTVSGGRCVYGYWRFDGAA